MEIQNKIDTIKKRLKEIYKRDHPPECEPYLDVIKKINAVLENEDDEIRPRCPSGFPGGIIYLKHNIPTIIVPDIHARMDFFLNILLYQDSEGITTLQKLDLNKIQIVCVGDGLHSEKRSAKRWNDSFSEFTDDYSRHTNIDEEMKEGFGVMEMIMGVKTAFPLNFHFLKGNHENISNEEGEGNHPFIKFSYEGPMVAYYVKKFYGEDFLNHYYSFEKNLPIFAVGKNFLISHSEPQRFYDTEEIIDYKNHPEVIEGLTWTDDDNAMDGSVLQMITKYLPPEMQEKSYYFGGHRPIFDLYQSRAEGKYIKIHNPNKFIIAYIKENEDINLDEDIFEIENKIEEAISEEGKPDLPVDDKE